MAAALGLPEAELPTVCDSEEDAERLSLAVAQGEGEREELALALCVALPQTLTDSVGEMLAEGGCEALGLPEAVDTCVEGAGVGLGVPVVHCDPALLAVGDWLCDSVTLTEALAEAVPVYGAEVAAALGLPEPELQKVCNNVEEGEKLSVPLPEGESAGEALGVCE